MSGRVVVAVEQLRRSVPGGIGRYATGLLDGLAQLRAADVELRASRAPHGVPDPLSEFGFPVCASVLPARVLTRAWDLGIAPVRHGRIVHSVSLASPPVRPTRRRGGPALVVTVHDLAWRTHPDTTTARGRRWHEAALARALARADAFVVPSLPVSDSLVSAGADPRRVRVIPHGVDHLPAPDHEAAAALLARAGVRDGYLLAAATREPRKNLRRLTEAYARARGSLRAPWPLVVVGPSGWGDAGVDRVEGVVESGPVGDAVLAALYEGARVFAYVPLAEGFGLPPVEAMACGTPVVVSTAVPSTTPAPGTSPAALRVDPTTVEQIAAALVRASGDDALRDELVARAKDVVRPLSWVASAKAHVEWWEMTASGGAMPGRQAPGGAVAG